MIAPAVAAFIGVSIVVTSFISGLFGMAGGLILLGILLIFLDVAPAMVLFAIIQLGSNGWRSFLWRKLVVWSIVWRYIIGATAAFFMMRLVSFVPDKALVYLTLGSIVFAADLLPRALTPDISRPGAPYVSGVIIMTLQRIAGAAGRRRANDFNLLDELGRYPVEEKAAVSVGPWHFFTVYQNLGIAWFQPAQTCSVAFDNVRQKCNRRDAL